MERCKSLTEPVLPFKTASRRCGSKTNTPGFLCLADFLVVGFDDDDDDDDDDDAAAEDTVAAMHRSEARLEAKGA